MALKHPAKMKEIQRYERDIYIPQENNTNTPHPSANNSSWSTPESEFDEDGKTGENTSGKSKKMVRFASDIVQTPRNTSMRSPPPNPRYGLTNIHNMNVNNNLHKLEAGEDGEFPRITPSNEAVTYSGRKVRPILTLPKIMDHGQMDGQKEIHVRKGSKTTMTILPANEQINSPRTPQNTPAASHKSPRAVGGFTKRVQLNRSELPPSYQDHKDFQQYLKEKYPHIVMAMRDNPKLSISSGKSDYYDNQQIVQNFYIRPQQTDETQIIPSSRYPEEDL